MPGSYPDLLLGMTASAFPSSREMFCPACSRGLLHGRQLRKCISAGGRSMPSSYPFLLPGTDASVLVVDWRLFLGCLAASMPGSYPDLLLGMTASAFPSSREMFCPACSRGLLHGRQLRKCISAGGRSMPSSYPFLLPGTDASVLVVDWRLFLGCLAASMPGSYPDLLLGMTASAFPSSREMFCPACSRGLLHGRQLRKCISAGGRSMPSSYPFLLPGTDASVLVVDWRLFLGCLAASMPGSYPDLLLGMTASAFPSSREMFCPACSRGLLHGRQLRKCISAGGRSMPSSYPFLLPGTDEAVQCGSLR
ncbi:uncharacterized protein LOC128087503 isoform X1 [Tympanuchus pallidicinctus]|uniref:uncharacterized protein LOC128087503 isoform X1 n=2 Tax=Tympanuchus pallidicinctus TaxID=109042 RepID=UPI002286EF2B|nr:uncharacterized protein LOC128087503 isoform X1 [Tympanuchus pallidicinctus]